MNMKKLQSYLDELIVEGREFLKNYPNEIKYYDETDQILKFRNAFDQWQHNSRSVMKSGLSHLDDKNFEKNPLYTDIDEASTSGWSFGFEGPNTCYIATPLNQILNALVSLKRNLEQVYDEKEDQDSYEDKNQAINILYQICDRFSEVARELIEYRHDKNKRTTITMNDEYDTQDLFRALLHLFFDEVIPEEYSPSYAGGKSRIDFSLPSENIIIEIKFASDKLRDKEIGEELVIDNTRYKGKEGWDTLFCFVYDPNRKIRNVNTLKRQLEAANEKMIVIITN